jgi:hypothetical protein
LRHVRASTEIGTAPTVVRAVPCQQGRRPGPTTAARQALQAALAGLGPAPTKPRALVLADLAANHRALGDDE